MTVIDTGDKVRPGEELDIGAVDRWVKQQLPDLLGEPIVTQYSGGASNWTYRLQYPERDLVLRRPPAGTKAANAHDMLREYRIQQGLGRAFPYAPPMVAACDDHAVIGCDFYVMERIAGIIPRANMPRDPRLARDQVQQLCTNMLNALIELHKVDYHSAGLAEIGKGEGYVARQIAGWDQRYENARTWNVPSFKHVRRWLQDNIPADSRICVIHNDWRFDNLVLAEDDPTRIIAVLDWELATLGDPLMDLGCALAYWVQADDNLLMRASRRQPSHLEGMFSRRQVVDCYLEHSGLACDNWAFYEVFGLFRLACIAQQIYFRYHHRQTRNPAFKHYWLMVNYLDRRCRSLIRQSGH